MPVVRYGQPLNIMVVAKGHPYERDPFMAMFDTPAGHGLQPCGTAPPPSD